MKRLISKVMNVVSVLTPTKNKITSRVVVETERAKESVTDVIKNVVEKETKEYTLNELAALEKKKKFIHREPAKKRDSAYRKSISVDLNTGCFELMKRGGFVKMATKFPEIMSVYTTRQVMDNTQENNVEFQGILEFGNVSGDTFINEKLEENKYEVKITAYTTSCSVQVQNRNSDTHNNIFLEHVGETVSEYIARLIESYVNIVVVDLGQATIDKTYLPVGLDERIDSLNDAQSKKKSVPESTSGEKKCQKCPKNVVLKNTEKYSTCDKCGEVEHFNCRFNRRTNTKEMRELILVKEVEYYCTPCIKDTPSLSNITRRMITHEIDTERITVDETFTGSTGMDESYTGRIEVIESD